LFGLGIGLLVNLIGSPALAGRLVLNQTPQTIERYFGRYWTRLTTSDANGNTVITYTYSPRQVRRLFSGTENSTFSIIFVNNRSQTVRLDNMETLDFYSEEAAQFFEYIFGYQPPRQESLGLVNTMTGYGEYEFCLGNGVETRFNSTGSGHTWFVSLYYSQRCEP
jgi:hypothetical protein